MAAKHEGRRRAPVPPTLVDAASVGGVLDLPHETSHYFSRVLRLKDDVCVELFDGNGRVIQGSLCADGRGVRVDAVVVVDDELPPLWILQAQVRGAKLDEVAQRGTELGMARLVIFEATRSTTKHERVKLDRLRRIVDEAARQCGRVRSPVLDDVISLDDAVACVAAFPGIALIGVPDADRTAREALHADARLQIHGALLIVGPEGGLTTDEVTRFAASGATRVRLGAHVLRTETASLAGLAAMQSALGLL